MNTHLSILHLKRREDRLQSLLKQLQEQEICFYSIVEGIEDRKNTKKAITLGHKKIIQKAKDNNEPNCIVAEDDIIFTAPNAWQYFLTQIPDEYNLFCGLIYHGTVENNRVMNGMSGVLTLFSCHSNFYDVILNLPDDCYTDRELGGFAHKYKYLICSPQVCYQSGGISDNLKREMFYWPYMEGKDFYGRTGQKCVNGIWE